MRQGLLAVLIMLFLLPGGVLAFQSGAFDQMVRILDDFLSPVVVAQYTYPPAPTAFATAQPVEPASTVAEAASQKIPVADPAPAPEQFSAQLPADTNSGAPTPSSNDLVHTSVLAAVLAAFESKIDAQILTITKPPAFPQQVAAGGNGVFSYGAAAAASSYVPSVVPTAPTTFSALSGSLNLGSQVSGALAIANGGTGITTAPVYGQLLMGAGDGTFALVSTSSLGITGGGGSGIVSSGIQGQFAFYNAAGTTLTATSSLFLAQNGFLGIGTTTPTAPLSVEATNADASFTEFQTSNTGPQLNFNKAQGIESAPNAAGSFNEIGKIGFNGYGTTRFQQGALILAANDGGTPFSDTSSPGRLEFRTTPIGTTATVVRMTVKNDGAIGIGTTSPWGRLSIDTSNLPAGVPEFTIGSSTRQDFIVTQNGNVGIGTTAPWGLLSIIAPNNSSAPQLVVGSSTATSLFVSNTGSVAIGTTTATHDDGALGGLLIAGDPVTDRTLEIHNSYAEGINVFTHSSSAYWRAPTINLNRSRGTQDVPAAPSTGDLLGGYQFGGYDGSTGYNSAALIQSSAEGTFTSTNSPANLIFSTTPPGASYAFSPIERMRISAAGNLGIATTTPWGRLSIDTSNLPAGVPEFTIGSSTRQDFIVTQNGYVGIGTTTPATLFDVEGTGSLVSIGGAGIDPSVVTISNTSGVNPLEIHTANAQGVNLYTHSDTGFRAPVINLFRSRGTQSSPAAVQSGDLLGYLTIGGGYNGSAYASAAQIQVSANENWNTSANGAKITFYTASAGNAGMGQSMTINNQNVGIGTTSPDMLLTVGSNSPSGAVAHFENSTGSCYINPTTTSLSCSSDARLKTNVVPLDSADGLAAVLKLNPVTYNWKTEPAATSPHTGFIAQDVKPVLPDLVSQGPDGYYTLNYAGLTPYLVKAIQEIATISGAFKTNLIAFLGSASNGIGDFFAHVGHFDETDTGKLCINSGTNQTCITQQQLAALLSQSAGSGLPTSVTSFGGSQVTNSANTGNANSTPPVIAINGENPATITVGSTYADLGATITAPQADVNLSLTVVVDNATSTDGSVQIDTSTPGTHTILYTVTDPSGLTGSATRTVIVSPASTPQAANDNTPPAANDNNQSGNATGTTGQ